MALILLCKEVIEPTASAVTCDKNDRICDIILQLYLSAWCQISPLTKTRTESENVQMITDYMGRGGVYRDPQK